MMLVITPRGRAHDASLVLWSFLLVVQLVVSGQRILVLATDTTEAIPCMGFGCSEDDETTMTTTMTANKPCTGFDCIDYDESSIGNCSPLTLDMSTDGRPQDISFKLTCDDVTVWQYPSDMIPLQKETDGYMSISACIFPTWCCEFSIQDTSSHKDDELITNGGYSTYLILQEDGKDIIIYDSSDDESLPSKNVTKTFGDTCSSVQEEDKMKDDIVKKCGFLNKNTPVHFAITLDDHPEQTSWYMICDGSEKGGLTTLWDVPRGSLANTSSRIIKQEECISDGVTCIFSIVDSQGDGLSSGGYSLTFGNDVIGSYDSSVDDGFAEMSYCLGNACEVHPDNDTIKSDSETEHFQPEYDAHAIQQQYGADTIQQQQRVSDENVPLSLDKTTENQHQHGDGLYPIQGSNSWDDWAYPLSVAACVLLATAFLVFVTMFVCRNPLDEQDERPSATPKGPLMQGEDDACTVNTTDDDGDEAFV